MNKGTNALENNIISNIDNLITIIIKISQDSEEQNPAYLQDAEKLINRTNPLLLHLLNGKEELLEQTYRQLIYQKLPNTEILKSFGSLENTLQKIFSLPFFVNNKHSNSSNSVKELITITTESSADSSDTHDELHQKSPEIILDSFINSLYPEEIIIKNHYLHSTKINYFLPRRRIGILLITDEHKYPTSLKLLCQRENINLVKISPNDLNNLHRLFKKIIRLQYNI